MLQSGYSANNGRLYLCLWIARRQHTGRTEVVTILFVFIFHSFRLAQSISAVHTDFDGFHWRSFKASPVIVQSGIKTSAGTGSAVSRAVCRTALHLKVDSLQLQFITAHTHTHAHTPTHTHTHLHTHTPTHTHTYTHTHLYTHKPTHTPTHTHTYTNTYTHTYTHTDTNKHTGLFHSRILFADVRKTLDTTVMSYECLYYELQIEELYCTSLSNICSYSRKLPHCAQVHGLLSSRKCQIPAAKLPLLCWHSTTDAGQKYISYCPNYERHVAWTPSVPVTTATLIKSRFKVISFARSEDQTRDLVRFQRIASTFLSSGKKAGNYWMEGPLGARASLELLEMIRIACPESNPGIVQLVARSLIDWTK